MNKRRRKKRDQKEISAAIYALWNYKIEPDMPCDDLKCESCYKQGPDYEFLK